MNENILACYICDNKSTIGTCAVCGKFICNDCCMEVENKNYCKSCVIETFKSNEKKIDKLESKDGNVYMNAANATSNAPPYPVNSVFIHIVLFFLTAGIGNILYFIYIIDKQNRWKANYTR